MKSIAVQGSSVGKLDLIKCSGRGISGEPVSLDSCATTMYLKEFSGFSPHAVSRSDFDAST